MTTLGIILALCALAICVFVFWEDYENRDRGSH